MMNSLREKIEIWVLALAWGVICLGCASTSPKPEAVAPLPAPQKLMPPPPQTLSAPRELPPPRFEPVPAPSQPDLPEPAPKVKLEAKPKAQDDPYFHTVKWNGETVTIIAGWYTGNVENWKALAQANPNMKPNLIFVGNKILIPKTLLKTREPMPKEFVDRFYSKFRKEKVQPKLQSQTTQPQEEGLTLVGPKKSPKK